ncbi:MAG: hypothetical protein MZV70_73350 [Desulfobacterales bacterium]|nr:hypothetical protein [Desulfobacterales bacterium]
MLEVRLQHPDLSDVDRDALRQIWPCTSPPDKRACIVRRASEGEHPMEYDMPLYRPPSEARSLIFQVTLGCSWNRCMFCAMYKTKSFLVRPFEEMEKDVVEMSWRYPRHQQDLPGRRRPSGGARRLPHQGARPHEPAVSRTWSASAPMPAPPTSRTRPSTNSGSSRHASSMSCTWASRRATTSS